MRAPGIQGDDQNASYPERKAISANLIPFLRVFTCLFTVGFFASEIIRLNFDEGLVYLAGDHYWPVRWTMVFGAVGLAYRVVIRRGIATILGTALVGFIVYALALVAVLPRQHPGLGPTNYSIVLNASVDLGIRAGLALSLMAVLTGLIVPFFYNRFMQVFPAREPFAAAGLTIAVLSVVLWKPLAATGNVFLRRLSQKSSPAPAYKLEPSPWSGYIQYGGMTHHFTLVITEVVPNPTVSASGTAFRGYMDWGPHIRLKIEGAAEGNHLQFLDTAVLIGNAAGGLGEKKDVWITGDQMVGTDKNGMALLHAQRSVGSIPQSVKQ